LYLPPLAVASKKAGKNWYLRSRLPFLTHNKNMPTASNGSYDRIMSNFHAKTELKSLPGSGFLETLDSQVGTVQSQKRLQAIPGIEVNLQDFAPLRKCPGPVQAFLHRGCCNVLHFATYVTTAALNNLEARKFFNSNAAWL